MSYQTILPEQEGRVLLITLNRPKALNALNTQLAAELIDAATRASTDGSIDCIVITGSQKAFAAAPTSKKCKTKAMPTYMTLTFLLSGMLLRSFANPQLRRSLAMPLTADVSWQ